MKVSRKAYIVTGLVYVPVVWAMSQIWWSVDFKECKYVPVECLGVDCEYMGAPAPDCSPTAWAWFLLVTLAILPIAALLLWKRFRRH